MDREEMVDTLYAKYSVSFGTLAKLSDKRLEEMYVYKTSITREEFNSFLKVAEALGVVEVLREHGASNAIQGIVVNEEGILCMRKELGVLF